MKRNSLFIGLFCFIILGMAVTSCASGPGQYSKLKFAGESEQLLSETKWVLRIDDADDPTIFVFKNDGNVTIMINGSISRDLSKKSSWERNGNTVKIVFHNGEQLLEGVLNETKTRISIGKYFVLGTYSEQYFEPYIEP